MKYQYTVHEKKNTYNGFFKIDCYRVSFEKFTGGVIENVMRECSAKGDIVSVLPYDPIKKTFLMVEQFRIGMHVRGVVPWNQEIVAGFMDVEGESPEDTAKRELIEETGCSAIQLYPLIEYYPSPGGSGAKNYVFIATVDSSQAEKHTGIIEEGEDIYVKTIPLDTVKTQLKNKEIDNATAIIALQQFFSDNWPEKL